jgi:hypothetical protein
MDTITGIISLITFLLILPVLFVIIVISGIFSILFDDSLQK